MWLTCSTLIEILFDGVCMASLPGGDDAARESDCRLWIRTQGDDALVFRLDKLRCVLAFVISLERGEMLLDGQILEDRLHGVGRNKQRVVGGIEHRDIYALGQ